MKTLNPNIVAQETARPTVIPPDKTLLDMLYFMQLTRELEFRIERKLYRQGKIVGGVYVGRGQEAIAVGSCIDLRQADVVCPSHRDMGAFPSSAIRVLPGFGTGDSCLRRLGTPRARPASTQE